MEKSQKTVEKIEIKKSKSTTSAKKSGEIKTTTSNKKASTEKTPKKIKASIKTIIEYPKNIKILGYHDLQLNTNIYDEVENPKAVVLILHGMMEHCGRYDNFAKFLNKQGFVAITTDLRGHGLTATSKSRLGFGEEDIYNETLQDLQKMISFINSTYALPLYVFAHSYGSLLCQRLIQIAPSIEKCVLCGTTNGSSAIMKLGGMACKFLSLFKSDSSKGGLLEKMCIKAYGKKFENGNWFSRDESIFAAYLTDEYCGGSFPFGFYRSMILNCNKANSGIKNIGQKKIFLIVGSQDPVGANGKHVKSLHKLYLKNNVNSKLKIYENCRHELLNELNKNEVYEDIVNFFNS